MHAILLIERNSVRKVVLQAPLSLANIPIQCRFVVVFAQ